MNAFTGFFAVCVAIVLAAGGALGELTVSVTLTGPIDEVLPLLEDLREMGVGASAGDDALKLEMHSVATPGEGAADGAPAAVAPEAAPAPAVPAAPPEPSLAGFRAEPAAARAGEKVWVSILVLNGVGVVDTVSATPAGTEIQFELHDNGENGDPVAGDGQWSAEIVLPVGIPAGQVPLQIVAFNADGQPVKVKDAAGQMVDLAVAVALTVGG